MQPNLLPHLLPLTRTIGFIEAPLVRVAEEFCAWEDAIFIAEGAKMSRQSQTLLLETALRTLLPITTVRSRRALFVATASPWTAFFENGLLGTDPAPIAQLALRLGTRSLRATYMASSAASQPGRKAFAGGRATIFELFGPSPAPILNGVRSVYAMHDGDRWDFGTHGEPLPFEDVERFRAKAVRDRFGPADLERYLRAFGIEAFDPSFYEQRSVLCENTQTRPPATRDLTLEEAQNG